MSEPSDKVVPLGTAGELLGRSVRRAVGKKRMDVILDRDGAPGLVAALPAEDLYFLVREIGLDDAAPLVGLSSPEQMRAFVDLDAWRPGEGGPTPEPDPVRILAWLAASRTGGPAMHEARFHGLDLELVELVLKHGLRIVDLRAEEEGQEHYEPGDQDLDWVVTPCGSYRIALTIEGAPAVELKRLVDDLYAENPFGAARLLSAVRFELVSEMSEHALRFRNARLEDLGFPPGETAASLYAHVDAGAPPPPQPELSEPRQGFFLAEFEGERLLDRAAARVPGPVARTRLDRGLMYLANTVLVADRVDPSDPDAVHEAIARMRAYLDLGLERLAGGDVDRAAALLSGSALKHLFQVGFSRTLELAWRARPIAEALSERARLDTPEAEVVLALLARRPRVAKALDLAREAGWPAAPDAGLEAEAAPLVSTPAGVRAFATEADLDAVRRAVDRAGAFVRTCEAAGLLADLGPSPEAPLLSALVLTAGCAAALGEPFGAKPLSRDAARRAIRLALDPSGAVRPDLAGAIRARLGGAASEVEPEAVEALVALSLARLEAELGPAVAAGGEVDPALGAVLRVAG